jgi:hypothetical protein
MVCHEEGSDKPGWFEIKWYTSATVNADVGNILGGSVHTIKTNKEALVFASKETGLVVNADKTQYMVTHRDQNAGRRHNKKNDNSPFEMVEQFKYFGITLTNKNFIHEETKSRMKSGNAC